MAFNLPIKNYFNRVDGPSEWVRPTDWPAITDTINEVQFLMSDLGDSNCSLRTNFTRTSGSQNMVIDWGDSTTTTITTAGSQTTTNKTYTPGTGTPCSLGYTTFKIRVYFTGTGVSVLSQCQITALHISGNNFSTQNCAVLEAHYGDLTVPSSPPSFESQTGSSSSVSYFDNLTYVKLPAGVNWTGIANMFRGCTEVTKIIMPKSAPSLTSVSLTFGECSSLLDITFPPNATAIDNLLSTFSGCYNLITVTLPISLNSCGSYASAFSLCTSLRNVTIPSSNITTSFNSTFNGCTQLEWVKFTGFNTSSSTVDFSQVFQNCFNLQNVYFPATISGTGAYSFTSTFSACSQLKSITLPSNMNVSGFSSTFANCFSLISCTLPTSTPACSTFASAFTNCYSLTSVQLPTTVASGVALTGIFANCFKLQTVTIPSGWVISSLLQSFNNCIALKTLNWTPGVQNSLTTMGLAFNGCQLLTSVTLPSSMTTLNTLSNTFTNCRSLISVTFPSSLNTVTRVESLFSGCNNLTSVTLPTSMSACTNFSQMFVNCRSITSVTLPATVSASTTNFSNAFNDCGSLKTIVFPSVNQLSSVTSINGLFVGCSNLVTITNFGKIGSLTATPLIDGNGNTNARLTSISFAGPMSAFALNGSPTTILKSDVQSVRLLNISSGQWTGGSPQINVSYTNMSTANLIQLFNDMAAGPSVIGKTINITLATGAAGLTAGNRSIITTKGWTITG
jgi:hypothetical protein